MNRLAALSLLALLVSQTSAAQAALASATAPAELDQLYEGIWQRWLQGPSTADSLKNA